MDSYLVKCKDHTFYTMNKENAQSAVNFVVSYFHVNPDNIAEVYSYYSNEGKYNLTSPDLINDVNLHLCKHGRIIRTLDEFNQISDLMDEMERVKSHFNDPELKDGLSRIICQLWDIKYPCYTCYTEY